MILIQYFNTQEDNCCLVQNQVTHYLEAAQKMHFVSDAYNQDTKGIKHDSYSSTTE